VNDGPLIVQSDKTLLLEIDHERAQDCRKAIAPFAELERSPEHMHTYRLTPLGLWNARAAGHDAEQVVDALVSYSRYAVPQPLLVDIVDTMARYGRLQLVKSPAHGLTLVSLDRAVLEEVLRHKKIAPMLGARIDDDTVIVHPSERGRVKQMLLKIGWPAEDLAGYVDGEAHPISLRQDDWHLRDYQHTCRCGGHGQSRCDDADPGHQHRGRPAMETRARRAHLADRGRDRRILRGAQGNSAGHDLDVSDGHPPHQGRVPPS
jgi:DNA excision repair protein ERCC-3